MSPVIKIVVSSVLIILLVLAGILLHQKGKPYNELLFAVHKICTIVMIILMVLVTIQFIRQEDATLVIYLVSGTMAFALVALIASGGMMSLDKLQAVMLWIHRVATAVFLLSYSFFAYFLLTYKLN